jgi:hypothetical protein
VFEGDHNATWVSRGNRLNQAALDRADLTSMGPERRGPIQGDRDNVTCWVQLAVALRRCVDERRTVGARRPLNRTSIRPIRALSLAQMAAAM